jgi:signal transduction histidine kinase
LIGQYATERGIQLEIGIDRKLDGPLVPPALYDGVVQNLLTNALKAVTASASDTSRTIAFRGWNEDGNHYLEVSDTGVGIPSALRERVFDPLFTTTSERSPDPLGSGMGLGLALVRRGVEAFDGRVDVVDPPPNFNTCVRVSLPLYPTA